MSTNKNSFFKEYEDYLIETDHTTNSAAQYCTYLRKTLEYLKLGDGFIDALLAISDQIVRGALCEYVKAKLYDAAKTESSQKQKKHLRDWHSAVVMLTEFLTQSKAPAQQTGTAVAATPINSKSAISVASASEQESRSEPTPEPVNLVSIMALPCDSVYDKKALMRIFKARLMTQDRYYNEDNCCFPTRIINKINPQSKIKDIYKHLIESTRFLYAADKDKFFRLSEIDKLTIKTDGSVKIEVEQKEYDVYTEVYSGRKFIGYEPFCADSIAQLSLDHIIPLHSELQKFLSSHAVFRKLSDSVMASRGKNSDMKLARFSKHYFATEYPSAAINDASLIDEVAEFIDSLELCILDRRYNSSKNDSVSA